MIYKRISFSNIMYLNKWVFSGLFLSWFLLTMSDFIDGYGQIPLRFLRFMFLVITIFAVLYCSIGIYDTGAGNLEIYSQNNSEIPDGRILMKHKMRYENNEFKTDFDFSIISIKLFFKKWNISVKSFWDNLYFSLVIFSTLGLGDLYPDYAGRIFVGIEAIIGAISIAYFVSITTKKYI